VCVYKEELRVGIKEIVFFFYFDYHLNKQIAINLRFELYFLNEIRFCNFVIWCIQGGAGGGALSNKQNKLFKKSKAKSV
jgi:hypothetical protein